MAKYGGDQHGPPLPKRLAKKLDALSDREWHQLTDWLAHRFELVMRERGYAMIHADRYEELLRREALLEELMRVQRV